jgi:hypothetical protein
MIPLAGRLTGLKWPQKQSWQVFIALTTAVKKKLPGEEGGGPPPGSARRS